MQRTLSNTALLPGSLILVTGVSGFTATHIADQLLAAGYRVRGTTRDAAKCASMIDLYHRRYDGKAKFELVQVSSMEDEECFDKAAEGVDGIIHTAFDSDTQMNVSSAVTMIINGTLNILQSASKSPSVQRFIYTSATAAAYTPGLNGTPHRTMTPSSWNEAAVTYAKGVFDSSIRTSNPTPGVPDEYVIYGASKTLAEQAIWHWVQGYQPKFTVNTVLPGLITGKSLDVNNQGRSSTALVIEQFFQAQNWNDAGARVAKAIQPNHFIDVQDVARLHVAALLSKSAVNERIFGCAGRFNWNQVLAFWRAAFPWSKFADDMKFLGTGEDETDLGDLQTRADEIMKSVGYDGFEVSLKQSMLNAVEDL
ncbi:NAD(P)-binding protein [Polyplosphaeria fusca]|uniref:NAD(P)-binding protein n=1 Tax=Polyplosphaeria fusca TaxID=682080 RepID=A0A9P4RAT4_9PLEO|nr:NAD(P)-binding protein [Polyplosphaeria fusca]